MKKPEITESTKTGMGMGLVQSMLDMGITDANFIDPEKWEENPEYTKLVKEGRGNIVFFITDEFVKGALHSGLSVKFVSHKKE